MSADIEKLAVFDGRIVQSRPKYAVEKGALSLTNAPFNAIAANTSQHSYNIYVPSENVFVDRALEWSSTVFQQFQVAVGAPLVAGNVIAQPGKDFALCAFPLNSLCSTMSATINDTTTVINSQDVLKEVLRLTDYKKNRLQRTCPTFLDKYQSYNDAAGAVNNPLAGYENATDAAEVPNGAFFNLVFTNPAGAPLGTAAPAFAGANYDAVNGVPVVRAGAEAGPWTLYVRWRSTEKLVLSPFVFSDTHEWDTGLFGINNIQLIMNLQAPSRLIRSTSFYGRTISQIGYNASAAQPFQDSVVNVQFLTPSLDVPLPPKSVVPYMEFPRYISQYQNGTIAPGATGQIVSQTITLPQIPDLFIIYAKPSSYGANEGDWYFPLATRADGVNNPITVNFDNFSGLLSSMTTEQLYAMCVNNGLEMNYNEWVGVGHSGSPAAPAGNAQLGSARVPLVGSLLVLKPSKDITLQAGQAPSLVGNFTFQFNLTVKNTSGVDATPQLTVITANSGFFESIRGSSRIIKGVLSEQDIIAAPLAPMGTRDALKRYVGGRGMFGSLANLLSRAKEVYHATKPALSAMKQALPEGKMRDVMSAVGYGEAGAGRSMGAGKKGLAARMM